MLSENEDGLGCLERDWDEGWAEDWSKHRGLNPSYGRVPDFGSSPRDTTGEGEGDDEASPRQNEPTDVFWRIESV